MTAARTSADSARTTAPAGNGWGVAEVDGTPPAAGPAPVDEADEAAGAAEPPSARRPSTKTVAGTAIAVLCLYELAAEVLNRVLGVDLLPSVTGWIRRWSLRRMAHAMRPPRWVRTTAVLDLGLLVHLLGRGRRAGTATGVRR